MILNQKTSKISKGRKRSRRRNIYEKGCFWSIASGGVLIMIIISNHLHLHSSQGFYKMLWYLKHDLQGKTNRTPPYGNGKAIAQWRLWTVPLTLQTFMLFMRFDTMLSPDTEAEHFILSVFVHGLCFLPIKQAGHKKIFWIWFYSLLFLFNVREKWK